MTHRLLRPTVALALALAVIPACSSDDPDDAASSTTAETTSAPELSLDVDPTMWGPLAGCDIGPQSADPGGTPADEGVDGVMAFGTQTQEHVEACVDSAVRPAVGGDHYPTWANCGFYSSPVPEEAAVHVLEHGGVWIAFDPELPTDQVGRIRSVTNASTHILANPYPGLTSGVVLTAWSRQLTVDDTNDPRFDAFIDTYLQGPNTPELGAPCDGGIGEPDPA